MRKRLTDSASQAERSPEDTVGGRPKDNGPIGRPLERVFRSTAAGRAVAALRLAVMASFAFISAAGASRAADPCADKAIAVEALHEGDEYQAAALLFTAARLGCMAEARALIDRGAAIDAKDREGATALARAAQAGKTAIAELLIDKGANVNARAVDGSTPLFYAAEADRPGAIRLL